MLVESPRHIFLAEGSQPTTCLHMAQEPETVFAFLNGCN